MLKARKLLAGVLATGTLAAVAAPAATAQPEQDGLVNVMIGDVTILEDVNVGVAANVAANVCGVKVGPVAVLGTAVDRSGESATVCEVEGQEVRLVQN